MSHKGHVYFKIIKLPNPPCLFILIESLVFFLQFYNPIRAL